MKKKDCSVQRNEMVEDQVFARGVRDPNVLEAMCSVPREDFLPESLYKFAYEDRPLPIAAGQTISQPYMVAAMIEALALEGGETVLEIGTGSGYAAAVISKIADKVFTVERIEALATTAAETLKSLGYLNVHVLEGDGTKGCRQYAPFDAIVVAAGAPKVPDALKEQLKVGGRMVIPVGEEISQQELVRVTRVSETQYETENITQVRFVPLIGEQGWQTKEE